MDERHLFAALRYVEMNPVAAGIVSDPAQYRWSSARSHLEGTDDPLVSPLPLQDMMSECGNNGPELFNAFFKVNYFAYTPLFSCPALR